MGRAAKAPRRETRLNFLETFPVHDGGARLVIFLFGDPHLLEGGQRGEDGTADPDGVFTLGRRDDFDFHGGRRQGGDLLLHTVGDAGVHGGTWGTEET